MDEAGRAFRERRPHAPSLTREDFDPSGCDLDAQGAWRDFGGKTLDEAYELFSSNPLFYQERFMFMGSRAFEYYFPVIDRHLRGADAEEEWDDQQVDIIGSGITMQLDSQDARLSAGILDELRALTAFVFDNMRRFSASEKDQRRFTRTWSAVREKLASGAAE